MHITPYQREPLTRPRHYSPPLLDRMQHAIYSFIFDPLVNFLFPIPDGIPSFVPHQAPTKKTFRDMGVQCSLLMPKKVIHSPPPPSKHCCIELNSFSVQKIIPQIRAITNLTSLHFISRAPSFKHDRINHKAFLLFFLIIYKKRFPHLQKITFSTPLFSPSDFEENRALFSKERVTSLFNLSLLGLSPEKSLQGIRKNGKEFLNFFCGNLIKKTANAFLQKEDLPTIDTLPAHGIDLEEVKEMLELLPQENMKEHLVHTFYRSVRIQHTK